MPTYHYRCKSCKNEFEEFQSITAEPFVDCPNCRTPNLERIVSAGGGMIFKGSGFYKTDYKKSSSSDKGTKPSSTKPAEKKD
jgi:putative FmdB family regulatory protein